EMTDEVSARIKHLSQNMVVAPVFSPERLLDQTALFLHRDVSKLPDAKRSILYTLRQTDSALAGKKVLIVDDDIRNIFALMSVLERHKMRVESAENGRDAINMVDRDGEID